MAKDARVVQRLARSRKVAYMTHWLFLPHSEEKALRWIDFTAKNFARLSSMEFAIQLRHGGRMVGLIGLDQISAQDSVAELWYTIVPSCWGRGYATEAARAAVRFGFEDLGLNRILAGSEQSFDSIHNSILMEARGLSGLGGLCWSQRGRTISNPAYFAGRQ